MIKSREDAKFYLQEDTKVNRVAGYSQLTYWVLFF